ncbi:LysM peptidoglycan-binding domain-containing protein [Rhodovulum sp. DZ06]|uniref:LysM peptidoglycan-binding domain-containing protein n=1 Tax=Rhodovulum sp. DZ06 TaxID=3425126 RepID=UPI003D33E260
MTSLRFAPALVAAFLLAAPAATAAPLPGSETTLEMVQRIGKGRVSDRRLTSIAPKVEAVIGALGALADQDAAAASGAPITDDTIAAVRASVQDLAKAARFNRIPDALLHAMLEQGAEAAFGGRVPAALQDGQGRLDAAQLLAGVVGATQARTAKIDADYLAAINGEGARTTLAELEPEAPAALTPTAAAVAEPDPFLSRVELVNGERWITVQVGDTLGSIAVGAYGDSLNYQRIYAANRDVLRTPNTIAPGQRLRLPE